MAAKAQQARARIDNTKKLSLDERVAIIETAINEVYCPDPILRSKRVTKWLKDHNYEPMMFTHAHRIWLSKKENK